MSIRIPVACCCEDEAHGPCAVLRELLQAQGVAAVTEALYRLDDALTDREALAAAGLRP
jgi:hypothetical protein